MNSIFKRTSVRKYTGEKISEHDIDMLMKAGMAAPSAMNAQPWEFVVVQDRTKLDKIENIHPYAQMLDKAGLAIVVCADTKAGMPDLQAKKYWVQDCSAATQNILLEATELGLGGVWLGTYPKEELCKELSKLLELPENIMPVTIISIGHPTGENKPKDKFDKNKVHYDRW